MLNWASEFWYLCVLALVVGLLTAAWVWLRLRPSPPETDIDDVAPSQPAGRLEPNRPVIDVASPVSFSMPDPVPAASPRLEGADSERPAIAAALGAPDDLSMIKGVGPKLNALLGSLGVSRFDQIAAWTDADIAEVDRFLGNFQGRIERDNWVDQARFLSVSDHDGFTAKYGALGGEKG